jgi:hypothetical protein
MNFGGFKGEQQIPRVCRELRDFGMTTIVQKQRQDAGLKAPALHLNLKANSRSDIFRPLRGLFPRLD